MTNLWSHDSHLKHLGNIIFLILNACCNFNSLKRSTNQTMTLALLNPSIEAQETSLLKRRPVPVLPWQQIRSRQYLKVGILNASKIPGEANFKCQHLEILYLRCTMTCEKQELQPIHAMTGIWDWMDWMDWLSLHGIACWSDSNWPYQRLKSGLYKLAMGIPVWGLLFLEACASFAKSQPHAVPGNQIGSRRATGVEPASKILYKSLLREVCKSIKILSPQDSAVSTWRHCSGRCFLLESVWDARLSQMFKWSPEDFKASHHTGKALTYTSKHEKNPKETESERTNRITSQDSQVCKDLESRRLPQLVPSNYWIWMCLPYMLNPALNACSLAAVVELEAPLTRPVGGATQKYDRIRHEFKQELRNHVYVYIYICIYVYGIHVASATKMRHPMNFNLHLKWIHPKLDPMKVHRSSPSCGD